MKVTSRYCEHCGIKIPLEDIRKGFYLEHEGDFYCMKCKDEVLPHVPARQPKKAKKKASNVSRSSSGVKSSGIKSRSRSRSRSDVAPVGSDDRGVPYSRGGSNQMMVFGGVAGALGLVMIILLFVLASGAPDEKTKDGPKKDDGKTGKTNVKSKLEKQFEDELQRLVKLNAGMKIKRLRDMRKKIEGRDDAGKIVQRIDSEISKNQDNIYQGALRVAKGYEKQTREIDRVVGLRDLWMRNSKKSALSGSKYQGMAQKKLDGINQRFMKLAEEEYNKLVGKARDLERTDDYSSAVSILKNYSIYYKKTKFWTEKIKNHLTRLERMIKIQEKFREAVRQATVKADERDYEGAIRTYRDFIATCDNDRWKSKARTAIQDVREQKREWEEEKKNMPPVNKDPDKNPDPHQPVNPNPQMGTPKYGQWVQMFNGSSLSGWQKRGNWQVQGGALVGKSSASSPAILIYPVSFSKVTFQFKLKIVSGRAGVFVLHPRNAIGFPPNAVPQGQWVTFNCVVSGGQLNITASNMRFRPIPLKVTQAGPMGFIAMPDSHVIIKDIRYQAQR